MNTNQTSRRQFIKQTGTLTAGAALAGALPAAAVPPNTRVGHDSTIRLALIGCGGRGTGAVKDALSVSDAGPVKLHAMADLDQQKIDFRYKWLKKTFTDRIDVPKERMVLGFDAYKKTIDMLKPGDIAMCTTRAYIRHIHVEYAVSRGINVFFEKPFASDPGGLHRLLKVADVADQKGVKAAAGLQCRHSPARQALIEKIRNGEMGEIPLIRANRLGGGRYLKSMGDKSNVLAEQLQFGRIHLLWVGSGHMVDNLIHQIDECCWIKDAWPVDCVGLGGRAPGTSDCGQNIDVYAMEYTFADGTKAFCGFRRINKTDSDFATYVHGTKCAAQFSGRTHAATVHLFKDQRIGKDHIAWTPPADAFSPWQYEWNDFLASIRKNRPHNEIRRAVYADLASLMGRAACHTGKRVTWDDMMKSRYQFCDYLEKLTDNSPVPVKADENGQFPYPIPGKWTEI